MRRLLRRCLEKDLGPTESLTQRTCGSEDRRGGASDVSGDRGVGRVRSPASFQVSLQPLVLSLQAVVIAAMLVWSRRTEGTNTGLCGSTSTHRRTTCWERTMPVRRCQHRTPMIFTPDGGSLIIQVARRGGNPLLSSATVCSIGPMRDRSPAPTMRVLVRCHPTAAWIGFNEERAQESADRRWDTHDDLPRGGKSWAYRCGVGRARRDRVRRAEFGPHHARSRRWWYTHTVTQSASVQAPARRAVLPA